MDEAEARARFTAARVARLATVRAGGAPHLVPVVFAVQDSTVLLVVDEKPKRTKELQRLANVRAEPRVSLLADHYEDAWGSLWWVRADGRARVVEDGPERDRAVALLQAKYPQYAASPPTGPAVVVDVESWRWWSFG
ncbi:MAG TPA: TIGR03668 family PPOX class F420-dependent oxidoreductase [Actinomycetota bacterium]